MRKQHLLVLFQWRMMFRLQEVNVTDLMVVPGLINLDFADVKTIMNNMGRAMMGTGEASGDNRAIECAHNAVTNPLLDDYSLDGAKGLLINWWN